MTVTAAAMMRPSHGAARVTAAPATALRSLSREVRDIRLLSIIHSGIILDIRKKNLRPDTPGARDALDAPWQGTYCSQRETHRQREFRFSTPWHRAFGRRMPGRRASGHSSPWHLLTGRRVSGHFPSGRSRVRAFSFSAPPCQCKWRPDDTCYGTTVTLSVKVQNIVANTLVAFANTQRFQA